MLRKKGVVGKFVEFYGSGLADLPLADRATIANMAPEYGATCGIFPVDAETLRYLRFTGRPEPLVQLVEAYCKEQGLFHTAQTPEANYTDTLSLDLGTVEPSLAGPKRPQDRVALGDVEESFADCAAWTAGRGQAEGRCRIADAPEPAAAAATVTLNGDAHELRPRLRGHRRHHELHEHVESVGHAGRRPAGEESGREGPANQALGQDEPGARLEGGHRISDRSRPDAVAGAAALLPGRLRLHDLHRQQRAACRRRSRRRSRKANLVVAAVLSGNRNFEGRVHPEVRANYLASPPLVVAYALAGRRSTSTCVTEPLGTDTEGKPVYLKDIWPTQQEVQQAVEQGVQPEMFHKDYDDVFTGDEHWTSLPVPAGDLFTWEPKSTYVKHPPYFDGHAAANRRRSRTSKAARVLAAAGRQHHHRPHLPGRLDQGRAARPGST